MKKALLAILSLFLFSGCSLSYQYAFMDPQLKIEEESLKKLAQRDLLFWEYYSNKDFEKSYALELPHLRFLKSLEWYKTFNEPNRKGYKITLLSIKSIDDNKAIIQNKYEDSEENSLILEDRWVLVDEEWYHYFEFSRLPTSESPF